MRHEDGKGGRRAATLQIAMIGVGCRAHGPASTGSFAFSQPAIPPGITNTCSYPSSKARPAPAWQLCQPGPEQ